MSDLDASQKDLLSWLGESEFSQYGECHGKSLDRLVELGLAQLHKAGENQTGFIAQDRTGSKGDMFRAVSLTEKGYDERRRLLHHTDAGTLAIAAGHQLQKEAEQPKEKEQDNEC